MNVIIGEAQASICQPINSWCFKLGTIIMNVTKSNIVHYEKHRSMEAQKFLFNIGEMARANFQFQGDDFPVLSKMKDISSQSTSYIANMDLAGCK